MPALGSPSPRRARALRAVVCGTTFGQVYLEAFSSADAGFELAGVLAQGSARSRACAAAYGVPLFTDPAQLGDDVDAACVVVRSGFLGGRGTELARALLARGIHVLQEHPVHHDELAACLREARRHGVVYLLNSFYVHLEPVRRFLAAGRELLARQAPLWVDASCGFQVGYALLDIIGTALGTVSPWRFADPLQPAAHAAAGGGPPAFRSLDGAIGGVPVTLRIQNQLDASDPDNFAHLMHRVTLGTEGGNLMLVSTHGPIVWSDRPRIPRGVRDPSGSSLFRAEAFDGQAGATSRVLGPAEAPCHKTIFTLLWPEGVRVALAGLRRAILDGTDPLERGQYHLALCRMWQEIAARLGPPDLVRLAGPGALPVADLARVERAASGLGTPAVETGH
jgi:thiazolinyl imide reductase